MSHPVQCPKKLIEVALPLDDINVASAREKSIRHGHPSTLHLWWARRPLAAARAVIFAQLVNDPASLWELQNPGKAPSLQQRGGFTQRRNHLFELISELVKWENTTNEEVLQRARKEIRDAWRQVCALNAGHPEAATLFDPAKLPGLHDPFAGGGTIPLEAQRLGLEAFASDLSQAIIGPGMAVFSKYAAVLEADGKHMPVKTALQLINRFLAEDDFDGDTQFCLHWFDQHGWDEGAYGEADVLARAKATSVGGLDQAGVVVSGAGKVRLRRWTEYPADWDPLADKRLPVWEALHQLIRAFRKDGESGAARILGAVQAKTEAIRQLSYRLYTLSERRGRAEDARAYNELITSWIAIEAAAAAVPQPARQQTLFGDT